VNILIMSACIARHRGFALAFVCRKSSSLLPGRRHQTLQSSFRLPSFHLRNFSGKRIAEVQSSLRTSRDDCHEKTILRDHTEDTDTVASNESRTVEDAPAASSGWSKGIQRRAGGVLSAVGFATSATRALLTDRSQQWKPTVDALRSFLKKSGIDLELTALLNRRLLYNIILLSRVEKAALKGNDRRDLALCSETAISIPTGEEALRYVDHFIISNS
jgi:hypothetical protein